jgi:hypothetical protein
MASGFFGVTGPWDLERGFELGVDDGVEGAIVDLAVRGLLAPLTQGFVRGKAGGLLERLHNGSQDGGGQREGFTGWEIPRQQGPQTARFVASEPVADGMAMDPQQPRHVLARLRLPDVPHSQRQRLLPTGFA